MKLLKPQFPGICQCGVIVWEEISTYNYDSYCWMCQQAHDNKRGVSNE